jgi:hypothetical protein
MTTFFTKPGQECSHAWELMPWVLQGSASEEQNDWLHHHLAQCPACSTEFAQQTRLRQAMALPADVRVDAEAGLQRLLGQLDIPQSQPQLLPARARANGTWVVKVLAAAVLVQAIGLGVLGSRLTTASQTQSYRTLSDTPTSTVAGTIRVVPDPKMALADWDTLLHSLQLQVVGGPNGMGAYVLAPTPAETAVPTPQAVQQLRAAPGVRLAEPIAAAP